MWIKLIYDVTEVINKGAFVNLVIKNNINKIDIDNRKIYTKIMYGVIENKKLIDYLLHPYVKNRRFKPLIKNTLRIGVYALSYLNLAPFYIVNSLVGAIKKQDYNASKAINYILRSFIKDDRFAYAMKEIENIDKNKRESIIYNIDEDILDLIKKDYPNKYSEILKNEDDTYNTYRINLLKTTIDYILDYLKNNNIEYELIDYAFITKQALIDTPIFANGLIIPQDLSSIEVAKTLAPSPDTTVLDVCSAPGSKAFHLATIMENRGQIIACDIYEHKLKLIEDEAKKLGITNITTKLLDGCNADYGQLFDYILVDAPCSGMGTMKHKGDLKLHLSISKIREIEIIQNKILNNVVHYLNDNGILVYSTCTINKNENEQQIALFLKEHPYMIKLEEKQYLPTSKQDGFYICRLQKKGK